jgi:hypothetical protein
MSMPHWLRGLLVETATVYPCITTTDSLGNEVTALGEPVQEPCIVQPISSFDRVDEPLTLTTHKMIALPDTVANTNGRIIWNGQRFDVYSDPLIHRHPLFARHHATVYLQISGQGGG